MVNGIFELLLTTPNLNPIKGNYSNLKLQYERDLWEMTIIIIIMKSNSSLILVCNFPFYFPSDFRHGIFKNPIIRLCIYGIKIQLCDFFKKLMWSKDGTVQEPRLDATKVNWYKLKPNHYDFRMLNVIYNNHRENSARIKTLEKLKHFIIKHQMNTKHIHSGQSEVNSKM